MFAIQCINKLYSYNRYVGLKDSGKPQIVYEGSDNYLEAIRSFEDKKSAEEFLIKILTREGMNLESLSVSDVVDLCLIGNSTEFKIIEYNIQDNKLEILNSYLLDPSYTITAID